MRFRNLHTTSGCAAFRFSKMRYLKVRCSKVRGRSA